MNYAKVILPDDMPKEAGKALRVLEGMGALASVAYAAAFLKDRAERQRWQNKIEKQFSDQGTSVKANIPENTPIVIVNEPPKTASLITKLAERRRNLINKRP